MAQTVKHPPTMWETWVQSLGQKDLLEKEMATHSSILAWKIPWTEEPGRLKYIGLQTVGHDLAISLHFTSFNNRNILLVLLEVAEIEILLIGIITIMGGEQFVGLQRW